MKTCSVGLFKLFHNIPIVESTDFQLSAGTCWLKRYIFKEHKGYHYFNDNKPNKTKII